MRDSLEPGGSRMEEPGFGDGYDSPQAVTAVMVGKEEGMDQRSPVSGKDRTEHNSRDGKLSVLPEARRGSATHLLSCGR